MKRQLTVMLLAMLLTVLFTGCCAFRDDGDDGLPPDALEPNDTPEEATLLTSALEGTMNEGEAPDVFRFEAVQGEMLQLTLDLLDPWYMTFDVAVHDPHGQQVALIHGHWDQASISHEFTPAVSGTYFVTLTYDYIGPADAMCIHGRARYRISLARDSGAARDNLQQPEERLTSARSGLDIVSLSSAAMRRLCSLGTVNYSASS